MEVEKTTLEEFEHVDISSLPYTRWNGTNHETCNSAFHLAEMYKKFNQITEVLNVLIRERNDSLGR